MVDYGIKSPSRDKAIRILHIIAKEIGNEKIFEQKRDELEDIIARIILEGTIECG